MSIDSLLSPRVGRPCKQRKVEEPVEEEMEREVSCIMETKGAVTVSEQHSILPIVQIF